MRPDDGAACLLPTSWGGGPKGRRGRLHPTRRSSPPLHKNQNKPATSRLHPCKHNALSPPGSVFHPSSQRASVMTPEDPTARLLAVLQGLDLTSADGRAGIGSLLSEIERLSPGAVLQQAARIELRALGWTGARGEPVPDLHDAA